MTQVSCLPLRGVHIVQTEWNVTLANGTLTSTPMTWRRLSLAFHGATVEASIDGVPLGPLRSAHRTHPTANTSTSSHIPYPINAGLAVTSTRGMVTLGSGVHWAAFDNFTVTAS